MTVQLIQEAAEAGANRTLGPDYWEHDILELVNGICDTDFTHESAVGKVVIVAYATAEIYWTQNIHVEGAHDRAVKYGIEYAEKHPYYSDVEAYYGDYDDPRRIQQ